MFGLFKSKKEIKITQLVWKNKAAKYKALLKSIAANENIRLFYFFNDTKAELQNVLQNYPAQRSVTIEPAAKLLSSFGSLADSYICFTEHHPSFLKENEILQHLQDTCDVKEVYFQVSLDEPLLQYFGSDNIVRLLEKMGFQEDEPVEHSMISKAVINAQKKLDEQTENNTIETSSAKEWFELNARKS